MACVLGDEPTCIDLRSLIRSRIMQGNAAIQICSHIRTARTLPMLERFYWGIVVVIYTRWCLRHRLKCLARKTPRLSVRWSVTIPLPLRPGIAVSVNNFRLLPVPNRGIGCIILFNERFSYLAKLFVVTVAKCRAESTRSDIINQSIPIRRCLSGTRWVNCRYISSKQALTRRLRNHLCTKSRHYLLPLEW